VEPVDTAGAPLVDVRNLRVTFPIARDLIGRPTRSIQAVDNVSFSVDRGETLGLVGESGCGKTTTGRATLLLLKAQSGTVFFNGRDVTQASSRERRRLRREMQMVFQDPFSSLDPRMRIGAAIGEPLEIHGLSRGSDTKKRVAELLDAVGLPRDSVGRFPHEFSGGQRQRVAVARALAVQPSLIICDEPISSLDVSVQAQVINLLDELQERYALTYIFIAHDLAAVRHIAHRIAVMYLGKIVEVAPRDELCERPLHPYTRSLLSAVPRPDPVVERNRVRIVLRGEVPSALNPPAGCRFHTRCPWARPRCEVEPPELASVKSSSSVACHYWREIAESENARQVS
jgi:oligopeptide/dipeptide ABC transporter ATP-binding protein